MCTKAEPGDVLFSREEEIVAVARLQAKAFHESAPIAALDPLLYYIFQVAGVAI